MKRCIKCGAVYDDNSFFCEVDGQKLVEYEEESSVTPESATVEAKESEQISFDQPEQNPVMTAPEVHVPVAREDPVSVEEVNEPRIPQDSFEPVPEEITQTAEPMDTTINNPVNSAGRVSFNYGMTVIEKAVAGVLIGIIVLAVIFGILFMTGVL